MTQTKKAAKREYVSPQIIVQVVIIILASSFGNLSQTATNAMLSGIAEDFQISLALGQWVTTLYMLVIGITVPVVTFLMRRFSLRQLILFSLGIFLLGCAVDIVAPVFGVLLLGRAMQAVSAGILMPMMMSVVMTSFPPNKRATVMGIAGIAMGFAPNIGPTIGGILITTLGWRSLFSIMIVVMVVLIVITCLCVKPGPKHRPAAYLDIPSLQIPAIQHFLLCCLCLWVRLLW
jgi:predicted MFS family arabinose efflux permease